MSKITIRNVVSDLNDLKLNKRKLSAEKHSENIISRFTTEELLRKSGEKSTKTVYTMDLRCEKLESIPLLKDFKHLKVLDVSSNLIKVIDNIQYFNELKELKIFDNHLENLSNLSSLKDLIVLQAQYNRIKNIAPKALCSCRKLKQIRLDNNCLSQLSLSDFSSCSLLTYLDVSFNNLKTISFISCLPNLEEFYASNNNIEIIADISLCKKLTEIRLSNNLIFDISGIKDNDSLVILDISNNKITTLGNIGKLSHMEVLDISNNQISIDQMKLLSITFPNLETLNANANGFEDILKILECLSNLNSLFELNMHDNPFPFTSELADERYQVSQVLEYIPSLKMLDNVCIRRKNNIDHQPLPMRPSTAGSGVSLKQVENQLLCFKKTFDELRSMNETCYNGLLDSLGDLKLDNLNSSQSKSRNCHISSKTARKSRLMDALVYASVNYDNVE